MWSTPGFRLGRLPRCEFLRFIMPSTPSFYGFHWLLTTSDVRSVGSNSGPPPRDKRSMHSYPCAKE
jgi:hypothetical protein